MRSVGHGRTEIRIIRVLDLAGSPDGHGDCFPHARQALKIVRRRRERGGRWIVRPSTPSPAWTIGSPTRRCRPPGCAGHWSIEAGPRWVRDVVSAEDHSQLHTDHGQTNLVALRTLAINALHLTGHTNIAAGLRQHARKPVLPLITPGLV